MQLRLLMHQNRVFPQVGNNPLNRKRHFDILMQLQGEQLSVFVRYYFIEKKD